MKKDNKSSESAYKTEDQLKAEAKARLAMEAKIAAQRKPPTKAQKVEKKVDNFLYHYKQALLVGLFVVTIGIFFIYDIVTKTDPDITLTFVTSRYISDDATQALASTLSEYVPDLNGDGKTVVLVDHLLIPADVMYDEENSASSEPEQTSNAGFSAPVNDAEMEYAGLIKLTANLSANHDPVFLLDKTAFAYIMRSGGSDENGNTLPPETIFSVLGPSGTALPFTDTVLADETFAGQFKDFSFFCRVSRDNAKPKDAEYFALCAKFIAGLAG